MHGLPPSLKKKWKPQPRDDPKLRTQKDGMLKLEYPGDVMHSPHDKCLLIRM